MSTKQLNLSIERKADNVRRTEARAAFIIGSMRELTENETNRLIEIAVRGVPALRRGKKGKGLSYEQEALVQSLWVSYLESDPRPVLDNRNKALAYFRLKARDLAKTKDVQDSLATYSSRARESDEKIGAVRIVPVAPVVERDDSVSPLDYASQKSSIELDHRLATSEVCLLPNAIEDLARDALANIERAVRRIQARAEAEAESGTLGLGAVLADGIAQMSFTQKERTRVGTCLVKVSASAICGDSKRDDGRRNRDAEARAADSSLVQKALCNHRPTAKLATLLVDASEGAKVLRRIPTDLVVKAWLDAAETNGAPEADRPDRISHRRIAEGCPDGTRPADIRAASETVRAVATALGAWDSASIRSGRSMPDRDPRIEPTEEEAARLSDHLVTYKWSGSRGRNIGRYIDAASALEAARSLG